MDSSCQCSTDSYYIRHDPDALRLELGPAYEDYKSGALKLTKRWEGTKSLVGDWLDPCCTELHEWKFADGWQEHTAMLAVFVFLAIMAALVLIILRERQPFKFRDTKAVVLHLLVLCLVMAAGVSTGNMAGTSSILPGFYASFIAGPLLLYYYIVKDLQLLYVYNWNKAKLDKKLYEQLQTFHKFRFVLDFRFYLAGFLAMTVLFAIPVMVAVTERDAFRTAVKTNTFDSIRCEWWKIPDEYTEPTSTSGLCNCVALQAPISGGDELACGAAVYSLCVAMEPGTPEDEGFCDICFAGYKNGEITKECQDWFENFYLSGYCGFPSRVPHQRTCEGSLFADKTMAIWAGSISYFMMLLNFIAQGLLWGKQDDFGIKQENMFSSTLAVITLFFQFAKLYPNDGGLLDWYYDGLGVEYDSQFFSTWLVCWGLLASTFFFPFGMFVYREYSLQCKITRARGGTQSSAQSYGIEALRSDAQRVAGQNDDTEVVEECLQDPALRHIYGQFTVEAFHAENVRFLTDCSTFVATARGLLDGETILSLAVDARSLFDEYIRSDAPLGVNIQSKHRNAIRQHLEQYETCVAQLGNRVELGEPVTLTASTVVQLTPILESLAIAYCDAYFDVRRLLVQDSWPRFRLSRHYKQYEALIQAARHMTSVVELRATPSSRDRFRSDTSASIRSDREVDILTTTTSEVTTSEYDRDPAPGRTKLTPHAAAELDVGDEDDIL